MPLYIFGYGSLMEKASRTRTEPKVVNAYPAIVTGYQRGWYNHDHDTIGFQPTFLGAVEAPEKTCYGVIFPVTGEQLARFNDREKGYTTQTIQVNNIKMLDGRQPLEIADTVLIYVTNNVEEPTFQYPIAQSYLDICVTGCQEIEGTYPLAKQAGFTQNFFVETLGWNQYWVNDRIYPRRPHIYQPNARDIDNLINQYKSDRFKQIQIEPAFPSNVQVKTESDSQVIIIKDSSQ